MLWKVLAGVAAVVIVFVVVVAMRASAYHVERKLAIDAPADRVFGLLGDVTQLSALVVVFGDPLDPKSEKSVTEQSVSWAESGHTGSMTIVEKTPGRMVVTLGFTKPMKSTATWTITLAPAANGTVVTWSMSGNHNFIGKAFGLFVNMDAMLAGDIEKTLARLDTAARS